MNSGSSTEIGCSTYSDGTALSSLLYHFSTIDSASLSSILATSWSNSSASMTLGKAGVPYLKTTKPSLLYSLLLLHIYWNMTLSGTLSKRTANIQLHAFVCLKAIVQTMYSRDHLSCVSPQKTRTGCSCPAWV